MINHQRPEYVYLDWNASTPLCDGARQAMMDAMGFVGNPSSQHQQGQQVRAELEKARGVIARAMQILPDRLVFTSGATEAANMVMVQGWDHVLCSPLDHDAVFKAAEALGKATSLPVDADGVVQLTGWPDGLSGRVLVCLHAANGETGVIQPVASLIAQAQGLGWSVLLDASQAFGKMSVMCDADYTVLSAHKFGGPMGVGALALGCGVDLRPLLHGGGQEGRRRPGTENLLGIVGMAAAMQAWDVAAWDRLAPLRDGLEAQLFGQAPDLAVVGRGASRLPHVSCFACPGFTGKSQLIQLDLAGFAVSIGSACSSGKLSASRVIAALVGDDLANCAIRVSFGPTTAVDQINAFANSWISLYHKVRRDKR